MSVRSWLGLCDHRWTDDGMIERKEQNGYHGTPRIVGYKRIQRCTICGTVRSVKL